MTRKLLGSVFLLAGTGWGVLRYARQARHREQLLRDVLSALRRLAQQLQMTREPLPKLLERSGSHCLPEINALLRGAAESIREGVEPRRALRREIEALPLREEELTLLLPLADCLDGREDHICEGIKLVSKNVQNALAQLHRTRKEDLRRVAVSAFCGAALLAILLI